MPIATVMATAMQKAISVPPCAVLRRWGECAERVDARGGDAGRLLLSLWRPAAARARRPARSGSPHARWMWQAQTLKNDFSKHVLFDCILSSCLSADVHTSRDDAGARPLA
jgi:hypothetical protein